MAQDSLLSDDLLRQLVAVGNVDILVGVPTLNHASTITDLVRIIQTSFSTFFWRQRTVLINSDGGSTDDTPAIVRNCCTDGAVTASHGLRTAHRITTPYYGLPSKANALRLIFAAADLLQAGVVVILDPDVTSVTPDWVASLIRPVRDQQFDFVAPAYSRSPADGLLVTQLLRPLLRAAYSRRIREPLAGEFGCSARFSAHCLNQPVWETELARDGIEVWIASTALAGPFSSCQTWLGPRVLAPGHNRPALPELFQKVVKAAFQTLEQYGDDWLTRTTPEDLQTIGAPMPQESAAPPPDPVRLAESFAHDVKNLDDVLGTILTPATLAAIHAAASVRGAAPRYSDELWAATVFEFLVAYHRAVMRREHITQALMPLYLARSGAFLLEHANQPPGEADHALESVCVQFEQTRGALVDRWNQASKR